MAFLEVLVLLKSLNKVFVADGFTFRHFEFLGHQPVEFCIVDWYHKKVEKAMQFGSSDLTVMIGINCVERLAQCLKNLLK